MNTGKGKIPIGKAALFEKIPLQLQILKIVKVIHRLHRFSGKMNGEVEEILRERKIEHTHGMIVSMISILYNKFT